jgi:hypothetical protein
LLLAWLPALRALRKRGEARRVVVDAAGVVAGGLLVGAGTFAALYLTGDWPEFLASSFGGWNRDYARQAPGWGPQTYYAFFGWEWPWTALHFVALPLALGLVARALLGRSGPDAAGAGDGPRLPLLAAFYLGWFFQANFVQVQFEYHVVPALLLAWALVLGWLGQILPRLSLAVALPAAVLGMAAWHPLLTADRLALWAECWASGGSDRLKDALAVNFWGGRTSWRELRGVILHLRELGARDREVTCWHFSTIPVYTEMGLEPSNRFIFPGGRLGHFPSFRRTILGETMNSPQRYVVMDLAELNVPEGKYRQGMTFTPRMFVPFRPRAVYHSGRYVVLELAPPARGGGPG